jgi:hypothetical protein
MSGKAAFGHILSFRFSLEGVRLSYKTFSVNLHLWSDFLVFYELVCKCRFSNSKQFWASQKQPKSGEQGRLK